VCDIGFTTGSGRNDNNDGSDNSSDSINDSIDGVSDCVAVQYPACSVNLAGVRTSLAARGGGVCFAVDGSDCGRECPRGG
jgi:hypothetical protein